ncbi:hypothetical protein JL475_10345 [Streptomyces sp. M2CJ-2]|uniref:hypothetical protein n=1 Tax=Streptomyces sp. M2CJ-2 TaxID=2803948 RepID=UPI001924840E|nr:hypothetical protein [Streptomyces sp. M2CJ-2]MBL3666383.1 hypothetical protein [Streptomyces sp. M2CJ-2]
MRKYQKAAVVMAMLGSVGFLGAGVSHAGDEPEVQLNNKQTTTCAQDNSTKGLINIGDVNVSLGILAFHDQEANDTTSQACSTSFAIGGE